MFSQTKNFVTTKSDPKVSIRLVINSFSGSPKEFKQSNELLSQLKQKNIKINEVIDVNQEMVFDSDKKIRSNLREHYHKSGKIYKINSNFILPQIIINESLALTYAEFLTLEESGLFDKIIQGAICEHVRIFEDNIAYIPPTDSTCIYCYSLKKNKQSITILCDQRNYYDQENHEITSFCEKNEITIKIYDLENIYGQQIPSDFDYEKKIIIDGESFSFNDFEFAIQEKLLCRACQYCGLRLNPNLNAKKCIDCISGNKPDDIKISSSSKSEKVKKDNTLLKTYNFIQKLKLSKTSY